MKLMEKKADFGKVELDGVKRRINLMLVPGAEIGDYLIVHAGCAIEILDESESRKTIALFREMKLVE